MMGFLRQIIDGMQRINNSDIGIIFSFIGLVAGIISSAKFTMRFYEKYASSVNSYSIVLVIVLLGLVFPSLTIFSTDWMGWKHIFLNILAIYGLFSFFMLLFIIKSMTSLGKPKSSVVS